LGLILGLAVLSVFIPNHPSGNIASSTSVSTVPTPSAKLPESNWRTDESIGAFDGVKTTFITEGHANREIIIRFRGKNLDAYVTTPEIVDDEDAPVRVRFDDGKPIGQVWSRSKDFSREERAAWQKKFDACMETERQSPLASVGTETEREDYCKAITQ
jgi:hypothetical protein